ncbi:hypothetical protein A4X13_0g7421 [Tilletia indica]|uniref:Uncharacterized protein n=1 Tax=Tilletia indica TaxID=43049 RepID=A0A177T4H5_9BASI|nr:hypothetical protein A4X13_0g7421 [Tilletia indica]
MSVSVLASPTTPASSVAGPERLVVPTHYQPSLLADLPNLDTISTLLAKHIPPHIRPARDTSGTPLGESPHIPDLTLAMRTKVWWRTAVYARDRILRAGASPSASPGRVDIEPAGPNDVCAVLMADHPLTASAPSSMLFTVPARARVAIGHLETDDVPSELCTSSFCSNADRRRTAAIHSFYSPISRSRARSLWISAPLN